MSGKNNGASGRARSGARRILYGTLAASVLVHLGIVAVVNGWLRVPPPPPPERMEVRLLEPRPPAPPDTAREIVELPPGPEPEAAPPEDARFRAERNSRVEQETAARDRRAAAQVAEEAGAAGSPAPTRIAPPKPEPPTPPDPLPPSPDAERSKTPEQVALLPNLQALSRMMGAPSPDRLRGVAEGDRTRLNAFLDPDAVFFNRLKRLVAQEWVPLVNTAPRPPNPTGEEREWVTEVLFVLDRDGEVVALRVLRSSGLEAMDESAVGAFRQVGRIPNPPARLLDDRGHLASVFTFSATERYQHVEWGRRSR